MSGLKITPILASEHPEVGSKRFDFGATVRGVDLNHPTAGQRRAIAEALRQHLFLHFPSQHAVMGCVCCAWPTTRTMG